MVPIANEIRLSEFKGKGKELLLYFPLYKKIKVETEVEEKNETEVTRYGEDEEDVTVLDITTFYENKDFTFLKVLLTFELKTYGYCPFCKKDLALILKGKDIPQEYKDSTISSDVNIDSKEVYDECHNYANTEFEKRYRYMVDNLLDPNGNFTVNLECTLKSKHKMQMFFHLTEDNFLLKIGQYPAIIDFEKDLNIYKKVLKGNEIKEFHTALGLKSHGVGIGSFVYLRRILEKLIYQKADTMALSNPSFDKNVFIGLRMNEKIDALKQALPEFLVNNKPLYGILSKGVHELEEKECLLYFDIVKDAILIILDENLEILKKEERKKEVSKHLNEINSTLKS